MTSVIRPFSLALLLASILFLLCKESYTYPPRRHYAQSIPDLKVLVQFESKISQDLTEKYLADDSPLSTGSEIRRQVKLYLLDFYEECGFKKIEDTKNQTCLPAVRNSICVYRLFKRVKYLLSDLILRRSFRLQLGGLWRQIIFFFWKNNWPLFRDLEFVAEGILRLHLIHDYDLKQFANGKISRKFTTNCTLSSAHCYEISQIALSLRDFSSAIEWLELAKEKVLVDHQASSSFIQFLLWNAIEKHNGYFDEDLFLDLEPTFFNREISHVPQDSRNATKIRNIQLETFKGNNERYYKDLNFLRLCSGQTQPVNNESELFCWYELKTHLSLTIGPMKMEFLSRDPDVVQIYEVLHDKEMQPILDDTSSRLQPSMVGGKPSFKGNKLRDSAPVSVDKKTRTALVSWYFGEVDMTVSQNIERITGLHVLERTAAEDLQIAAYPLAGHYGSHLDAFSPALGNSENMQRIATFMFYLSDVDEGGSTVFTSQGVAATPVKGSALFWYDVYTDGSSDWSTTHGACPVVVGEKWAANKWIHYHDQFLKRKCGLKRIERFRIRVNDKLV
ncbi:unnamed protein product [Allacma fusca]|uniref:Fe2OG dioxygenase domain-containing protein n=1 Tax=Allacma fusca TaxID=39272 RepID=A0A8J2PMW3_9HEXA|nr:unnamed protein product [Allacma fusca]